MEQERATKFIHELLELMVKQKGSDLFITAAFPPAIKVDGKIAPVSKTTLSPQHTIAAAQMRAIAQHHTLDCQSAFCAQPQSSGEG